jgi:predicted ATP-dependent serine protease
VNSMKKKTDRSKKLTVYICNECGHEKPCRKTYGEWEVCENSLHYYFRKQRTSSKKSRRSHEVYALPGSSLDDLATEI